MIYDNAMIRPQKLKLALHSPIISIKKSNYPEDIKGAGWKQNGWAFPPSLDPVFKVHARNRGSILYYLWSQMELNFFVIVNLNL